MSNEGKDSLFSVSLDDAMIETDDYKPIEGQDKKEETPDKKEETLEGQKVEKTEQGVAIHEDGTFEIDPYLEKAIAASASAEDEEEGSEDNDKDVKSEQKEDSPSDSKSESDSSPSSSPYLAFAKDRASEGVFLDFNNEDWEELKKRNDGDEGSYFKRTIQLNNGSHDSRRC